MAADEQVAEVHALVRGRPWGEARSMARAALAALGLGGVERRLPFRLSGGMAQRVAIAVTDAAGAPLLIADEPTKGLDADRRDEVADLLLARAADGAAVIVITHDIALARRLGGEVAVMLEARIVERGRTHAVLDAPRHDYTRRLVQADPAAWPRRRTTASGTPVVSVDGLAKALEGGRSSRVFPFRSRPRDRRNRRTERVREDDARQFAPRPARARRRPDPASDG